jgi:pSer/pThr/pTyr-binding forkhead associated (FHA) protein
MAGVLFLILRISLTAVFYIFLAWVFMTLWRDIQTQSVSVSTRQIPAIHLLAATEQPSASYQFSHAQISLGRDPACDCILDDETVSANHAQLVYRHNQWWVEDLNSKNGTFINDQRASSPIVLTSNDLLQFGKIAFIVTIEH